MAVRRSRPTVFWGNFRTQARTRRHPLSDCEDRQDERRSPRTLSDAPSGYLRRNQDAHDGRRTFGRKSRRGGGLLGRRHSPARGEGNLMNLSLRVGAALIGLLLILAFLRSVLQVAVVNRERGDW